MQVRFSVQFGATVSNSWLQRCREGRGNWKGELRYVFCLTAIGAIPAVLLYLVITGIVWATMVSTDTGGLERALSRPVQIPVTIGAFIVGFLAHRVMDRR